MAWRLARSLTTLFAQVNAAGPGRDKSWDGSIGDEAHSARKTDHNPDSRGIVHAVDITDDDTAPGFDATALADSIIASRDRRVKYMIHRGRIISGNGGPSPWVWRQYTGPNGHFSHLHVSVTNAGEDDTRSWAMPDGTLRLGSAGPAVTAMQKRLNMFGAGLAVDGDYGQATEAVVKLIQTAYGLPPDGAIGQKTKKIIMEDTVLTKDQDERLKRLEEQSQWLNVRIGGLAQWLGAGNYNETETGGFIAALADAIADRLATVPDDGASLG